jgi:peptidoglycan/LPS O-acetylase OafA/YrhL
LTDAKAEAMNAVIRPSIPVKRDLPTESDTSNSKSFYHPELDVLRFVAFCLVFIAHSVYFVDIDWAHLPKPLFTFMFAVHGAGYYGVDLFFVLSSYLITELLYREREKTGVIHLRKFYIRRMLRIWPLYFFFLVIVWPVAGLLDPKEHVSGRVLAAFLFLVGNWRCAIWGWPHALVDQLWSITVEEQFYLTWPILMRRWQKHLPSIAVGMLIVANLTRVYYVLWPNTDASIWCNTLARLDPISGGILLAYALHERDNTMPKILRWEIGGFAAAILLFVGNYGDHTDMRALYSYPLADLACVMLVFAALRPQSEQRSNVAVRGLVYLGQISYGLYVFHQMAFEVVNVLPRRPAVVTVALAMLLVIFLASLSYRFLETPFLRLKKRFSLVPSRDTQLLSTSTQWPLAAAERCGGH